VKDTSPVLNNINFKMGSSDLLVVAGRIGTGKTTLLFSILDETIKKGGT
jgi:ABC-type Mn2+/Zn2+ transport system ATPase subunit